MNRTLIQSLSQFEQLSTIGRAIGRSLRIEEITPDQARQELLGIMPGPVINMLLEVWAAAGVQPAFVTSTVEKGHRSTCAHLPRMGH
jgi:hypothetical protein